MTVLGYVGGVVSKSVNFTVNVIDKCTVNNVTASNISNVQYALFQSSMIIVFNTFTDSL